MNRRELKYILLVSLLLALSFPPFPLGFLAPAAFAVFLAYLDDKTPRTSFRLGYLLGLFWGALTLFWIAASTVPGAILAITINALHYAFVWWVYALIRQRNRNLALTVLPFLWVGAEYLRIFTDIRFNWLTLAYTQTYYRPFIQIADRTGFLGISFVVVLIGILLYLAYRHRQAWRWAYLALAAVIVILLLWYGQQRIDKLEQRSYPLIRAGLVQPDVDPYEKWSPSFQSAAFEMLMDASRNMLAQQPQLIVWPETATPFYLRNETEIIGRMNRFLDSSRVWLLTGTPDYRYFPAEKDYHTYNAAFFFRPGKPGFSSYNKMALVPASESMPFKETFPFLRKLNVGGGDFFPGDSFKVFRFEAGLQTGKFYKNGYRPDKQTSRKKIPVGLSAIICYESVFPQFARQFVQNGANLLAIITNDGWFGLTSGPYQHEQYAVYRAIENRTSIIRCANTGISTFITPTGKMLERAGLNTRKNLVEYVPVNAGKSFYTRYGDWVGKWCLIITGMLLSLTFLYYGLYLKVIHRKFSDE